MEAADGESGTPGTRVRIIGSRAWLARTLERARGLCRGPAPRGRGAPPGHAEGRGQISIIAHGCLGHLYLAQGDLEHAIRVLEQGLALYRAPAAEPSCE